MVLRKPTQFQLNKAFLGQKTRVLYIAGTARSGSTLLADLLSQNLDALNVGELKYIWDRGLLENWKCTCQESFKNCSFWRQVMDSLSRKNHALTKVLSDFSERGKKQNTDFRIRQNLFNSSDKIKQKIQRNNVYKQILHDLYATISEHSSNACIIDNSKEAIYGAFVSQLENLDFYTIHIVRDPRSVVYSQAFKKKKQFVDEGRSFEMGTSFFESIFSWYRQNLLIEKLHAGRKNYLQIRYEDLVADPKTINHVLKKIKKWGFENNGTKSTNHSFSGNPVRLLKNQKIRKKEPSEIKIPVAQKFLLFLLALPALIKYKYLKTCL